MQEKRKQKGVTLIALVITIIVLIILAGVSINMLVGESGIITQAQRAKENTQLAQKEEQEQLDKLEEVLKNGGISVVKIGNEVYTSIQKAIDSLGTMQETVKLTLLENTVENFTIAQDKKIELDLNNKILTGNVRNEGVFIFENGTLENKETDQSIYNTGNLTIKSGKINARRAAGIISEGEISVQGGEISSEGSIAILIRNGNLKLMDGTIKNITQVVNEEANGPRGQALEIDKGTAILQGGTITSLKGRAIGNHGEIIINGTNISSGSYTENYSIVLATVCNFVDAQTGAGAKITLNSGSITNTAGGYAISSPSPNIFEKVGGTVTGKTYGI